MDKPDSIAVKSIIRWMSPLLPCNRMPQQVESVRNKLASNPMLVALRRLVGIDTSHTTLSAQFVRSDEVRAAVGRRSECFTALRQRKGLELVEVPGCVRVSEKVPNVLMLLSS